MKDRIKEIRTNNPNGKNQKMFADYLGISVANLASYETGRRVPTSAVIQLICQKCNINEEWLRTGNGEKNKPLTRNEELLAFMNKVMDLKDDAFQKKFIEALARLDVKDWEYIQALAKKLLVTSSASSPANTPDISAAEADYEKSLGIAPSTDSTASSTIKDTENAG